MTSNLLKLSPWLLAFGLGSAQAAPDMVVVAYGGAGQKPRMRRSSSHSVPRTAAN